MDVDKLAQMLEVHEGFRSKPYKDTVGKLTIGFGRNLSDDGISKPEALYLLGNDISSTIVFLQTHCPWWTTLDDVRQRAIADLAFDIRGSLLEFHNMIAALEAQDWEQAANELLNSLFAKEAPSRASDLASMLRTGQDA